MNKSTTTSTIIPLGTKGDPARECLGRSVGGWTTAQYPGKIRIVVDALGNPLRLIISVGQQADVKLAEDLLTDYETDAVIAVPIHD